MRIKTNFIITDDMQSKGTPGPGLHESSCRCNKATHLLAASIHGASNCGTAWTAFSLSLSQSSSHFENVAGRGSEGTSRPLLLP